MPVKDMVQSWLKRLDYYLNSRSTSAMERLRAVLNIKAQATVESHNFEIFNNEKYRDMVAAASIRERRTVAAYRWAVYIISAALVALVFVVMTISADRLIKLRFSLLRDYIAAHDFGASWGLNFLMMTFLASIGCFTVLIEPTAGGSGIPEIIAIMNGIDASKAMSVKTLILKVVGVTCAVGASVVALGPEGTITHIGAMITMRLVRVFVHVKRPAWAVRLLRPMHKLLNPKDERTMSTIGSSIGLASAFNAPIGGTMFMMEQSNAVVSATLIFKTFMACIVAYYIAYQLELAVLGNNFVSRFAVTQTGCFDGLGHGAFLYFAILGGVCGLLGICFNFLSIRILAWRNRNINHTLSRRYLDVIVVVFITCFFVIGIPMAWECRDGHKMILQLLDAKGISESSLAQNQRVNCLHTSISDFYAKYNGWNSNATSELFTNLELNSVGCPAGQYNEMATLLHVAGGGIIRRLFLRGTVYNFSFGCLTTLTTVIFVLAVLVSGLALPSGLIIPFLCIGAGIGRAFCVFVNDYIEHSLEGDPGVWAVAGAAAFWCGSGRVALTVAIVITETTGDIKLLPGIFLTVACSKLVADLFDQGLYVVLVLFRKLPFLTDEPSIDLEQRVVGDIMTPIHRLWTLTPTPLVETIVERLENTIHNGFPVIDPHSRRLVGLALRAHLQELISERIPNLDDALETELDIGNIMNKTPSIVTPDTPLAYVFYLFRQIGVRHVCVINDRF
eukprot:Opistho-2@44598